MYNPFKICDFPCWFIIHGNDLLQLFNIEILWETFMLILQLTNQTLHTPFEQVGIFVVPTLWYASLNLRRTISSTSSHTLLQYLLAVLQCREKLVNKALLQAQHVFFMLYASFEVARKEFVNDWKYYSVLFKRILLECIKLFEDNGYQRVVVLLGVVETRSLQLYIWLLLYF